MNKSCRCPIECIQCRRLSEKSEHLVDDARADLAETRNVRCPGRNTKSRFWYVRHEYEAFDDDERPTQNLPYDERPRQAECKQDQDIA